MYNKTFRKLCQYSLHENRIHLRTAYLTPVNKHGSASGKCRLVVAFFLCLRGEFNYQTVYLRLMASKLYDVLYRSLVTAQLCVNDS